MGKKLITITEEDKRELIKLCEAGLSFTVISHRLPYKPSIIKKYIIELEASGVINYHPINRTKEDSIKAICDDYKAGLIDVKLLALKHNKTIKTINQYLMLGGIRKGRCKPHNRLPTEKTVEIQNKLLASASQAELAEEYNMTRQRINKIANKMDSKILPRKVTVKQQIINLLRQGKKTAEIARELNIPMSNVSRVKKDTIL